MATEEKRLQDDYQKALELGEVLVAYSRVMMISVGGVGKNSLLKGLMNQRLPQDAEGASHADTETVKLFWAKAGESADSYWEEVTDQDEIQELAGLVQLVLQVKSGHSTPSCDARILSTMAAAVAVGVFKPLGFIPHEGPTISDKNVSSIKDGVVRNVLQQALLHHEGSPGNPPVPQSEVMLHVWDCGGQPAFLDVLPAFLTSRTMFLLVFDARRDLLSKCETLSHKQGKVVSTKEESFTVLQLLMQWMACIHAVTFSRQNVAQGSSTVSATYHNRREYPSIEKIGKCVFPEFPRIIPVGTHCDDKEAKKAEILDTLRSHCEGKAFSHLLLDGAIVNNTTAGKQHEDPGFTYIRTKVHKFATDSLAVPTPVAWVLFRKVLQEVAKDNPIVSYEQAVAVGEACGIAADVVPSVLHFYHELAVFLHYTQIESLAHCIIADPQRLIKEFGKLLSPNEFQQEVSNQALWKPLQEKGILIQPLYEEVWGDSHLKAQSLADLLEHFCLAALIDPQTKATSFPNREYFIPSVLRSSSQVADSATEFVKKSSSLHLTFSTQYVPHGFFTRLATTLLKKSKCHLLFTRGVFRNTMTFAYGEVDKIDEFTMFEHSSSVQITVLRTVHRHPHIPTFRSVCRDIMNLIQACSAIICRWFPLITVKAVLCCQQCTNEDGFISLPPGATAQSVLRCQHDHISSLTREQQYWMEVPNTPEYIMQRGDFNNAELRGVADVVRRCGKLKELAEALEVVPLLSSLEGDLDTPFTLLRCWRLDVESGLKAHSLLVHHLKSIGMIRTSDRLYCRLFLALTDPSTRTTRIISSPHPFQDEKSLVSLGDIVACSHYIDGDSSLLAAALDIPDEQLETLKSKYKRTQSQVIQMLKIWKLSGTRTKQELTEILQGVGFSQAAQSLMTSLEASTTQQEPHLQDLISHVHTREWYRLGLQLDLDDISLHHIQVDAAENKDYLRSVFQRWLQVCKNPSWEEVVQALKAIGERNLGAEMEQKFCK